MNINTLVLLIFLRLLSALPFAVYYSSLQLYLLNIHITKNIATPIVGSVLALSYGTALVGGYIGGKYISYRALFLFCLICAVLGCFAFTTYNLSYILWFSSLFLLSSAGLTISLNMMVTQGYESHDEGREKAFFWIYMGLNIGYLIGYSISGYYGSLGEYQKIPVFVAGCSFICILLTVAYWKQIDKPRIPYNKFALIYTLFVFIILLCVLRFLLQFPTITNLSVIVVWILLSLIMFFILMRHNVNHSHDIVIFYILLFGALVFWSIYFLAPMALIVFIHNNVTLNLFNLGIAPQWIQNINTFVIILGTVILGSKRSKKPTGTYKIARQFSWGLFFIGISFIILIIGIVLHSEQNKVSLVWVISAYVLQSLGELFIGPISYALVGRLIPKHYHSFMMGIWITLLGVANAISSKLSVLAPYTEKSALNLLQYQHFFASISLSIILAAIFIYLISFKLTRLNVAS